MTSPNGSINKCQVYRFNSNSLSKFLFLDIVHSSKHRLIHVSLYHKRRCFCYASRIYTYKTSTFLYKMANTILLSKKEIAYIIGSNIPSSILGEMNILWNFFCFLLKDFRTYWTKTLNCLEFKEFFCQTYSIVYWIIESSNGMQSLFHLIL